MRQRSAAGHGDKDGRPGRGGPARKQEAQRQEDDGIDRETEIKRER